MNDIRRTILWVIFGFSMVLLWDQWQIYNGNKPTFFPSTPVPPAATAKGPAGASSVPASGVPSASGVPAPVATPSTAAPGVPGAPPTTAAPSATPRERITVSTDVLRL